MPNNVTNQITFGSDSAALAAFQQMLRDMQMNGEPLGSIDFNKLSPMPEELNMESGGRTDQGLKLVREYHRALVDLERREPPLTAAEYELELSQCEDLYREKRMADPEAWALGEQAYSNIQRFGSPTWHEWRDHHWGSKWNAYEFQPLGEDSHTMGFFTAWSPVPQIVRLLSRKYPKQTITYRWADEEVGYNVGELTLMGGEVTSNNIPADGSREAYEMSAEIMEINLSDHHLHLTKDGTSYEYRAPDGAPSAGRSSPEPLPVPKKQAKTSGEKRGSKGQDR